MKFEVTITRSQYTYTKKTKVYTPWVTDEGEPKSYAFNDARDYGIFLLDMFPVDSWMSAAEYIESVGITLQDLYEGEPKGNSYFHKLNLGLGITLVYRVHCVVTNSFV